MGVILYCECKMKIGILVQARMGSTRLPGKVLERISDEPIILRVLKELSFVSNASIIQVVTSDLKKDDVLCDVLFNANFEFFRGNETDVLQRYYLAAKKLNLDVIVRVNGDCPFIDPMLVKDIIEYYELNFDKIDYVSTVLDETFPLGMHIEVFSSKALQNCNKNATGFEREHVTPFIYNNPTLFRLNSFKSNTDLSEYRLTVDYEEDLIFSRELASAIDANVVPAKPRNNLNLIVKFLRENPELVSINSRFKKPQTIRYSNEN